MYVVANDVRGGAKFSDGKADSFDEGTKMWCSGYSKCQKSPKKSLFTWRRASMLRREGYSPSLAPPMIDVGTGGHLPPLFHKVYIQVSLFSLHSVFFAGEGAPKRTSPHFLNAFYVPGCSSYKNSSTFSFHKKINVYESLGSVKYV